MVVGTPADRQPTAVFSAHSRTYGSVRLLVLSFSFSSAVGDATRRQVAFCSGALRLSLRRALVMGARWWQELFLELLAQRSKEQMGVGSKPELAYSDLATAVSKNDPLDFLLGAPTRQTTTLYLHHTRAASLACWLLRREPPAGGVPGCGVAVLWDAIGRRVWLSEYSLTHIQPQCCRSPSCMRHRLTTSFSRGGGGGRHSTPPNHQGPDGEGASKRAVATGQP